MCGEAGSHLRSRLPSALTAKPHTIFFPGGDRSAGTTLAGVFGTSIARRTIQFLIGGAYPSAPPQA